MMLALISYSESCCLRFRFACGAASVKSVYRMLGLGES
jgi:hypothetical protein